MTNVINLSDYKKVSSNIHNRPKEDLTINEIKKLENSTFFIIKND